MFNTTIHAILHLTHFQFECVFGKNVKTPKNATSAQRHQALQWCSRFYLVLILHVPYPSPGGHRLAWSARLVSHDCGGDTSKTRFL